MQLIACPFCGTRDETEFRFGAEAGKRRGDIASTDADWASYLYFQDNPKGATREIWVHVPCNEFFLVERDSVTHAIADTSALRPEELS